MPDGTIVTNVPENITKSELLAKLSGNGSEFTGEIPEGVDVADYNINQEAEGLDQPYVSPTVPRTFKEKLFGSEGAKLAPGAEPLKFAYENPEVIAATAASMIAPPLAAPAAVSRLGFAAKLVKPVITNAPKVAAATAAGGAGGVVKEALNDPEATLDSLIEQGTRSAVEMGTSEVAGIAGAGLLSKVLAPGAKTLTEQGKKLIQFAKEHKLPLKPSVSPSLTSKVMEGATDGFLPSRIVKQFSNKKIANVLSTSTPDANNLIANVTKVYGENSPGLDKTIRSAGKALEDALAELTPRAEAKYGAFTTAIGGRDRWTGYPKLKEVLENIKTAEADLVGGRDEVTVGFASNFLGKYKEQISAEDLYKQYKRLSHLKGANRRNLGLLRDAFKEEFQDLAAKTGGDAMKLLKEANIEYALGKGLKDPRGVVKKIVDGKIPDNQVTVNLFRDSQYGTLKQIEARVPKKTFQNLQRLNLETLIQNSSVKSDFVSVLDGEKLLTWINKNPKTFGMYPAETQEALRNLGLYAKLHRSEAIAGTKGFGEIIEQTAIRTSLGGAALFGTTGIPGVVVSSVAAPALAYSMMRPNSVINKWLVRGEIGPFAKGVNEGLKLGGRLVFQDSTEPSDNR